MRRADPELLLLRALKLPLPRDRHRIEHEAATPVPASDGTVLLTDSWYPAGNPSAPLVLMRTPYGRGGIEAFFGRLFARHGFRFMIQSCRGTAGSTGEFEPFQTEASDGQAWVEWIRQQPWFTGRFATYGVSYAGYTAWALASIPTPELVGMVPVVAPMNPRAVLFPAGTMSAEVALTWSRLMPDLPSRLKLLLKAKDLQRDVTAAALAMPPVDNYVKATKGQRKKFFETWFEHDADGDTWWSRLDFSASIDRIDCSVLLVGAWHDYYTASMIEQFQTLQRRGVHSALRMSNTTHSGYVSAMPRVLPDIIAWLHDCLAGRSPAASGTVKVQEVGTSVWTDLDCWPPPNTHRDLHLGAGRRLADAPTGQNEQDAFRYDPQDPTPAIGGNLLDRSANQDNRPLEARSDVLTWTTDPLTHDLVLAGASSVSLFWECDGESFDAFVRILDVAPDGTSRTISDDLQRFHVDGRVNPLQLEISLSPTLARVKAGNRLRLMVSGGAHPRFIRNHGTAEPLATANQTVATQNVIHHGPQHPSRLRLSLLQA